MEALTERPFDPNDFPRASGVYLIFQYSTFMKQNECLYVGASRNMWKRWRNHHRLREFLVSDSCYPLTMAWILAEEADLALLEAQMILHYQPRRNYASFERLAFMVRRHERQIEQSSIGEG